MSPKALRFDHGLPRLLALALLLLAPGCGPRESEPEQGLTGRKVLFIGVDGATWKVIGPMIAAGELPTFARLVREGAWCPDFDVVTPNSPEAWTSVATGRFPADHGISGYTTRLADGSLIPVSSSQRKVPAVWEIASQNGVSVGVGAWWASWPAEPVRGWVITDHANPAFADHLFENRKYWTADPELLRTLEKDFYPPDVGEILARNWMDKDSFPYEALQARATLAEEQLRLLVDAPWSQRETYSLLKTFYIIDGPIHAAVKELIRERPTDLTMVYFRGPDPIQHYAWDLIEPEKYEVPREYLERDRGLVKAVYRYVDSFLGGLMGAAGPDTVTIVASDHGAEPDPGATGPMRAARPGAHTKAAKGVLFLHGPDVRANERLRRAGPLDILPTMLWLLGLPLSDELEGRPLKEAFARSLTRDLRERHVATYGDRETADPTASGADAAMLESLRSLGYLQ